MLINWSGNEVIFSFCSFYKTISYYFSRISAIFVIYNGVTGSSFEKKAYTTSVDKYWILRTYIYFNTCCFVRH